MQESSSSMQSQGRALENATLVLVHGGRLGGWLWRRLTPLLREAGGTVYAPTLTGLADRHHLLTPTIDLDVHVEDVRALIQYEDLQGVIVVGHSYGGMVITALCETDVRPRLATLIYLDALVPEPGDSVYDLISPEITTPLRASVARDGDGWRVPAHAGSDVLGLTDPKDVAWVSSRLSDQPEATYRVPLRSDAAARTLPRHYIRFTAPAIIPEHVVDRARKDRSWRYSELAAPHAGQLSHPREVALALLETLARD